MGSSEAAKRGPRFQAIVVGAAGRMGRELVSAVCSAEDFILAGATEAPGSKFIGMDAGEVAGVGKTGRLIRKSLAEAVENSEAGPGEPEVVLDFTTPEATLAHLEITAGSRIIHIIGTTGFSETQIERIRALAPKTRCVMAPNMSVGVNVLVKVVEQAAGALGDGFDAEVVEIHHRMKKDAPSGTARRLGETIAGARGKKLDEVAVYHREGQTGERPPGSIGMQTLRGGDVVGDHTVIFAGDGERIELTHRSQSRSNFTLGALRATRWVLDQPPGLYQMADVLDLK